MQRIPVAAQAVEQGLLRQRRNEQVVIGVALGMIQETVERTATDPGEAELAAVRREARDAAWKDVEVTARKASA